MYETEVNSVVEPISSLPADIIRRFTEFSREIAVRTTLPWSEHCTECHAPSCYRTCELYSPRMDGGCRQYVDGAVRINCPGAMNSYLLKIQFKRWGKRWTRGNLALMPPDTALKKELTNLRVGAVARSLPLPSALKRRVLTKVGYLRRRAAEQAVTSPERPDCFVLECYNPSRQVVHLTLTLRSRHDRNARAFQAAIPVPPGFLREQVPFEEISRVIDFSQPFEVEILPSKGDGPTLYFGLADFVKLAAGKPTGEGRKRWKCIVWDLDNTLWGGTLLEDGPEGIRLRQEVVDVIKETDQRGILHSIASKNNAEDALTALRMFGMEDYFLHPQIHWQPKSESILAIARSLNIGVDTIAFVDDQEFERAEVMAALPEVALIDAVEVETIPFRPEGQVPVTEESRQRRKMYRQQEQRQSLLNSFGVDYLAFLKDCNIRLSVAPLAEENLERVYELAQRTNRMNFSGHRYPRAKLEALLQCAHHESFVVKCTDRFGSYGIVGFAVVDTREPRLVDLMFSCRVQGKRVEHAFLVYLIHRFVGDRDRDFFVNYRQTSQNEAAGKVFDDLLFQRVGEQDGATALVFRKELVIPDEAIVDVTASAEKSV